MLVTPWPPEESGVAGYSWRLAHELARSVELTVVVGGAVGDYERPAVDGIRLLDPGSVDAALRRRDRLLFCMGNSHYHRHVYELMREHRGAVLFHDAQLTGFFGFYAGCERPEDPLGWLVERVERLYGSRIPPQELHSAPLSAERRVALGIYMTGEIQRLAERCFVHSHLAQQILEHDCGAGERRPPVSVMPFGMPAPNAEGTRSQPAGAPLVVHMGVLAEVKGLAVLIEAFAAFAERHEGARLVLAGPVDAAGEAHWRHFAALHAPRASVEIPGRLENERYDALLRAADLAVQLRTVSNGEASAAVGDCLAAGVPTIVTDLGWSGELPTTAVAHVPTGVAAQQLTTCMEDLIVDHRRRCALSEGALAHATTCSFGRVAAEYLGVLAAE